MSEDKNESMTSRVGLFDLDHTVLPYDTQALFCNYVLKKYWWRRFYLIIFSIALPLRIVKILDTKGIKRVYLSYLWGMDVSLLRKLAQGFAEEVVKKVSYPEVVNRIEGFHDSGGVTVLNTASPEFYAEEIAKMFDMKYCYGTRVVIPESGRMPLFPKIIGRNNKKSAKLVRMDHLFGEEFEEFPSAPMNESHGYSDSMADMPLLEYSEKQTLVNPDPNLEKIGLERDWEIMKPAQPYSGKVGDMWCAIRQALGFYKV